MRLRIAVSIVVKFSDHSVICLVGHMDFVVPVRILVERGR